MQMRYDLCKYGVALYYANEQCLQRPRARHVLTVVIFHRVYHIRKSEGVNQLLC